MLKYAQCFTNPAIIKHPSNFPLGYGRVCTIFMQRHSQPHEYQYDYNFDSVATMSWGISDTKNKGCVAHISSGKLEGKTKKQKNWVLAKQSPGGL